MSDVSLVEFVVPHAENHIENLEWVALQGLHNQKRSAISAMPFVENSINYYERVAKIFTNFRKGVLNMEYFYNKESKVFIEKLKDSLKEAKKQLSERNTNTKQRHLSEEYANQLIYEMADFEQVFKDEYNRIIPIVFPNSVSNNNRNNNPNNGNNIINNGNNIINNDITENTVNARSLYSKSNKKY